MEIKPQLKPRGSVAEEEDPKPSQQLYKLPMKSTRSTRRLCVCGIYERPLRVPAEENALALMTVGIGGKNTQEQDQVRIWAAPTAGPETSTVLEGILGRWVRERILTGGDSRKNIYYSYVFTCSVDSLGLFFSSPSNVVVDFIGIMKSN